METTVERVYAIATHLKKLPSETIQMYIDDALLEIPSSILNSEYGEKSQRYLVAHLATLDVRRPTSENAVNLSANYQEQLKELDSTEYGQEFKRIIRKFRGPTLLIKS